MFFCTVSANVYYLCPFLLPTCHVLQSWKMKETSILEDLAEMQSHKTTFLLVLFKGTVLYFSFQDETQIPWKAIKFYWLNWLQSRHWFKSRVKGSRFLTCQNSHLIFLTNAESNESKKPHMLLLVISITMPTKARKYSMGKYIANYRLEAENWNFFFIN